MPSKRELLLATLFFALVAVVVAGLLRPLDLAEWICLTVSLGFVGLGCLALVKHDAWIDRQTLPRRPPPDDGGDKVRLERPRVDEPFRDPTPGEEQILATTIAALEEADALDPASVDVPMLWQAAQTIDPGRSPDVYDALGALAEIDDAHGLRRLTFVPVHVEYDARLLADLTLSILRSLGYETGEPEVTIDYTLGDAEGKAVVMLALDGRSRTISMRFRPKDPPPDLFAVLGQMTRIGDPRELVCADPGNQTLLFAAIRPGALIALNGRFPVDYDMFGPF